MPKIRHHRSSRRVPPPKDSDFDHEINLVNRDEEESPLRSSLGGPSTQGEATSSATDRQRDDGEDEIGGEVTRQEDTGQPSVVIEGECATSATIVGYVTLTCVCIRTDTASRGR
jgi:hypothetical protein